MTTLVIANTDASLFYHIYCLLKTLAPSNAEFRLQMQTSTAQEGDYSEQDGKLLFERFSPHRELAIKAMCVELRASYKEAYDFVNTVFDERQKTVYDQDPSAVIRDLNLVLQERKRQEELKAQQRQADDVETIKHTLWRIEDKT